MTECPCTCHNGPHYPCTIPGGCGHLHRTEAPAPPADRCLTHRAPRPGQFWRLADKGFRTCSACYDRLHKWLSPIAIDDDGRPDSIPGLYAILDARPGITEQGRRGPGFATRSPASDWVIAMRDHRSTRLVSGDPHSVPGVLAAWCGLVAEVRDVIPPARSVQSLARFLDAHLDWVSRQDWVDELHGELRELHTQLRMATGGGGQPPVGRCIEPVEGGECGAPIYMPRGEKPRAPDEPITDLPELRCPACDSRYTGRRLILLRINSERRSA